jgi:hypothetical protein
MGDYTADRGNKPGDLDLSHGIIRREHCGASTTVGAAVARRLALHGSVEPNCYDHEVLLPRWAPDHLRDLARLVATYEEQLLPGQEDLLGIATVRFAHSDAYHHQWERARAWARSSLNGRDLVAILVHHVPGLAGRAHKPHIHLLYPVRVLHGSFGAFVTLDRASLAAEWQPFLESG